jgi:hypothetical protein
LRDPDSNPVDRALDILLALREVSRGPNTRHQHDARKTDGLRPFKHEILDALRKASIEQIAQLLTKEGFKISTPQLARAIQLFKKETRAERAGAQSPTTEPADPKLKQVAAQLVAFAQGPSRRYPRPAPKQDQLRERREQLLEDRKRGKTIPQIAQDLRKQGINISDAHAQRIIASFQKGEPGGRSTYNLPKTLEPLTVREEPLKDTAQVKPERTSKEPPNPKASASAKAREDDLQNTIKQARRSAAKGQKTKLPPGNLERGKHGPSRPSPER